MKATKREDMKRKRRLFVLKGDTSEEVKRLPKNAPNLTGRVENWSSWAERMVMKETGTRKTPFLNGPTFEEDCLP